MDWNDYPPKITCYEDAVQVAKESMAIMYPRLKAHFAKDGSRAPILAFGGLLTFIATTIAVDGEFSETEYKFYCDVTGCTDSYEEAKKIMDDCSTEECRSIADRIFDCVAETQEEKIALLRLCVAVITVDKEVSVEEYEFLKRLIR